MTAWTTPPPNERGGRHPRYVSKEIQAQLRERPGEWLHLDYHDRRAAKTIYGWCQRHPVFEATTRGNNNDDADDIQIYVRYVGKD